MSTRKRKLSTTDIAQAFAKGTGTHLPPILTTEEVIALLRIPRGTFDEWVSKGRLNGAFRRRGKRNLFWRDRVIEIVFNGPEWNK